MVLSETALSTMMQVSITGAGLLLAIYALIIPISRRIFLERAHYLKKKTEEFAKQRSSLTADTSSKEFKALQRLSEVRSKGRSETRSKLSTSRRFAFA